MHRNFNRRRSPWLSPYGFAAAAAGLNSLTGAGKRAWDVYRSSRNASGKRPATNRHYYNIRPYRSLRLNKDEWKYRDYLNIHSDDDVTGNHYRSMKWNILNVQTGTGANQRIGDRVTVKSIQIKGRLSAGRMPDTGRLVIVYDRAPGGITSPPLWEEVFEPSLAGANSTSDMLNMENRRRFKIVFDKTWSLGCYTGGDMDAGTIETQSYGAGIASQSINSYIKVNLPVYFNGTTDALSDISYGALYLYFQADVNPGTTAFWNCKFVGTARLRYSDN